MKWQFSRFVPQVRPLKFTLEKKFTSHINKDAFKVKPHQAKNKQTNKTPCTSINVLSYKSPGKEIFPPGHSERALLEELLQRARKLSSMGHGIKLPRQASCSRELSKGEPYKEGSRQWVQVQLLILLLISQCTRSSGLPSAEPCHLLPPWAVLQKCAQGCPRLQNTEWSRHTQKHSAFRSEPN